MLLHHIIENKENEAQTSFFFKL